MTIDDQQGSVDKAPLLDFPAAHSMDSTWWATDKSGQVALFETGEDGAMPTGCRSIDRREMIEHLAANDFGKLTFFADDLLAAPDRRLYRRDAATRWSHVTDPAVEFTAEGRWFDGVLIWLRDESVLVDLVSRSSGAPIEDRLLEQLSTKLFTDSTIARPVVRRLPTLDRVVAWVASQQGGADCPEIASFARGLLTAGYALRGWIYECPLEAERFGFFSYDHRWAICLPYEQTESPAQPAVVDDLPLATRDALSVCRLETVDFSRDPLLQPLELVPGSAQCDRWVTSTGCVVPMGQDPSDRPGPTTWWDVVYPGQLATTNMGALVEGWLRGELNAASVLRDYLQDTGRSPLPELESAAARLDFVLFEFFTPEQLLEVEADFVEHVFAQIKQGAGERMAIAAAIDAVRSFSAGRLSAVELQAAADAVWEYWAPREVEPGQVNRVAWAARSLARRCPLIAAKTARTLQPAELAWQVEYVVRLLNSQLLDPR